MNACCQGRKLFAPAIEGWFGHYGSPIETSGASLGARTSLFAVIAKREKLTSLRLVCGRDARGPSPTRESARRSAPSRADLLSVLRESPLPRRQSVNRWALRG